MLSNAYFLAQFRFDTAEKEPAKNHKKFQNFKFDQHPVKWSAVCCSGLLNVRAGPGPFLYLVDDFRVELFSPRDGGTGDVGGGVLRGH